MRGQPSGALTREFKHTVRLQLKMFGCFFQTTLRVQRTTKHVLSCGSCWAHPVSQALPFPVSQGTSTPGQDRCSSEAP